MQTQLARKRIINTLLVGTTVLGIGSVAIQPAQAQSSRAEFREMAEELDLSRSQMRQLAGVMRGFRSDIGNILTSEQLELLETTREQEQSREQNVQDLRGELNLTATQASQLSSARQDMVEDLRGFLTSEQIEGLLEMTVAGRF